MSVVHAEKVLPARRSLVEPRPRRSLPRRVAIAFVVAGAAATLMMDDDLLARQTTNGVIFDLYWLAFFLGLATAVVSGLQARRDITRDLILTAFALFTYLPKFLMSMSGPLYFDEYGQFRHANDALRTGDLFAPNTYQPIISRFPGLTGATLLVHALTRLSVWHSGQVVIVVAHVAALPVVAAIARRLGASGRMALLGALVYALNPSFSFFDAEFSYESVGMTLALLTILACLRTFCADDPAPPDSRWRTNSGSGSGFRSGSNPRPSSSSSPWPRSRTWPAVGLVAVSACVVTHHLSSLFADATCILVAICLTMAAKRQQAVYRLRAGWVVVGYGVAATALWLGLAASSLSSYLAPHFTGAFGEMLVIVGLRADPVVTGEIPSKRTLFAGSQLPKYEEFAAIASPFLALALVAGSVWVLWRTRRAHPGSTALLAPFLLLALAYFVSLPFSLTTAGSEISHRSWGYSYLGIAVVVAVAASRLTELPRPVAVRRLVVAGLMIVPLAVGNTALGVDVSYRFPGPYEFGTDTRSDSRELTTVLAWLNAHVPAGTGVLTDRFTSEFVNGFTDLRIPSPVQILPLALFAEPLDPSPRVSQALQQGGFRYFVLDKHILTQKPHLEFYPGATTFLPADLAGLRALADGETAGKADLTGVFATEHYAVFRIGP